MNMKANVPGWGEVWFNLTAMTNIFSYAQMVDRHPVTAPKKMRLLCIYCTNKSSLHEKMDYMSIGHRT
jgi:hypothetical protein